MCLRDISALFDQAGAHMRHQGDLGPRSPIDQITVEHDQATVLAMCSHIKSSFPIGLDTLFYSVMGCFR